MEVPKDVRSYMYYSKDLLEKVLRVNGTKKRFVFWFSRKLRRTESNYSIVKLELIMLIYGILAAKYLFLFAKVNVFIDAKSIVFLRLCKSSSPQLVRLALLLSSFDVDLYHI